MRFSQTGNASTRLGWAGRRGRRAGKRPQGMAKCLTFTERRLSFTFAEGTPRPESQAFRQPQGGPMEAALILRFLPIKEKEQNLFSQSKCLSLRQNPLTMKLAEALSIRKDLQKRIQQLGQRIQNNVKVQEGDAPSEEPTELMKELDACLTQLEDLIWRINATNMKTTNAEGITLTQLMARKDVLTMRVSNLRSIFDTASAGQDRYSRSEIKTVTVVDVKAIGKKVDECSAQLRQLDMEIQALNFQTELV